MKKAAWILTFFCSFLTAEAQIKAVTDTGKEVLLFNNGTWRYVYEEMPEPAEIQLNPRKFEKSEDATFLLKSNNVNVGIWLDPRKWHFSKSTKNEDAEYSLKLREGGDAYGILITEQIEIPLESFSLIALENARSAGPDMEIVTEEYRMVNGLKVLYLQMKGTVKGMKVSYLGYYYSNAQGSVQLITYTSQQLLDKHRKKCESLLNGITEIK